MPADLIKSANHVLIYLSDDGQLLSEKSDADIGSHLVLYHRTATAQKMRFKAKSDKSAARLLCDIRVFYKHIVGNIMKQQTQHEASQLSEKTPARYALAQALKETQNTCDSAYCRRVLRSVLPIPKKVAMLLQSHSLE